MYPEKTSARAEPIPAASIDAVTILFVVFILSPQILSANRKVYHQYALFQ